MPEGAGPLSHLARAGSGARVRVEGLTKRYDGVFAVRDVDLDIAPGAFVSLLGPSGSGKTTTLMAIAGFTEGISGRILLDGHRIEHLPPHRREIGVVFQNLALFPHMSTAENVAFPLRLRGVPRAEIKKRVGEALELVRMAGLGRRLPAELSGGQQQRVAFARAIIFDPKVLLLDEPLAALDRRLREAMQRELRLLHRRLGVTIIHVTHDQAEALSVSDRIVVMHQGRVVQDGTPAEIYGAPAGRFVADFIGESSFLNATVLAGDGTALSVRTEGGMTCRVEARDGISPGAGNAVVLMLRPERVRLGRAAEGAVNRRFGLLREVTFQGERLRLEIELDGGETLIAALPNARMAERPRAGEQIEAGWDAEDMQLFARQTP